MSLSRSGKPKSRTDKSFLFRGKSTKSRGQQLFEALILLIVGINLVFFLNTLPSAFVLDRLSMETLYEITSSFINLMTSLTGIGVALIVILLLVISLVFIISGIWRLLVIYRKNMASRNRRRDSKTK